MKKSEEYKDSKDLEYVKLINEQLKLVRRIRVVASNIQAASTQSIIDRSPEQDQERIKKLTDDNFWKELKQTAQVEHPSLVQRHIDPVDMLRYEEMRRRPKNSVGQSIKNSASEERKELARQTFTCTPASPLNPDEKEKLKEINKIKQLEQLPPKEEWRELNFIQALLHKLKGGEIKKGD